jgi:hypothetical protein
LRDLKRSKVYTGPIITLKGIVEVIGFSKFVDGIDVQPSFLKYDFLDQWGEYETILVWLGHPLTIADEGLTIDRHL